MIIFDSDSWTSDRIIFCAAEILQQTARFPSSSRLGMGCLIMVTTQKQSRTTRQDKTQALRIASGTLDLWPRNKFYCKTAMKSC
jgi:hypothetical protein